MLNEGSLTAILGGFGSGKSLCTTQLIVDGYREGYRLLVTNLVTKPRLLETCVDLQIIFYTNKEMQSFWATTPRNAMVFIDEVHAVWDKDNWKKLKDDNDAIGYWSQVRKHGDMVVVVTQRWNDIPVFIRERVASSITCYKFPLSNWFIRQKNEVAYGRQLDSSWLNFRFYPWFSVRPYADMYDTHAIAGGGTIARSIATDKRKKRKWITLPRLLLLALLGYFAFVKIAILYSDGYFSGKPAKAPASPVAPLSAPIAPPGPLYRREAPQAPLPITPFLEPENVSFDKDKGCYTSPLGTVVRITPDTVIILTPANALLPFPRDFRSEYQTVAAQRDLTIWIHPTPAPETAIRKSGNPASFGNRPNPSNILPRPDYPRPATQPHPIPNPAPRSD